MSEDLKQTVCAGTIVFRMVNGTVEFFLILPKKGDGKTYGFPKGHQEEGESREETAVRETFEETGFVVRLVYELAPLFAKNPYETKTVHFWLAKQLNVGISPKPQKEEVAACGWFSIENPPPIHSYQKPAFDAAIEVIKKNLT